MPDCATTRLIRQGGSRIPGLRWLHYLNDVDPPGPARVGAPSAGCNRSTRFPLQRPLDTAGAAHYDRRHGGISAPGHHMQLAATAPDGPGHEHMSSTRSPPIRRVRSEARPPISTPTLGTPRPAAPCRPGDVADLAPPAASPSCSSAVPRAHRAPHCSVIYMHTPGPSPGPYTTAHRLLSDCPARLRPL